MAPRAGRMTTPALSTRVDKTRLGRDGPSIDRVTAAARDVDHAAQRLGKPATGWRRPSGSPSKPATASGPSRGRLDCPMRRYGATDGRQLPETAGTGPELRNRSPRIAQDRRRGPPEGVRGPPDSCPARANTVATSSTGCAMASSTGAPSRRTTISTRRPFIDPPMARPLTYPLRRPSLRRGGWVCR